MEFENFDDGVSLTYSLKKDQKCNRQSVGSGRGGEELSELYRVKAMRLPLKKVRRSIQIR